MNPIVEVNVQSEIGKLNGVILHTPGEEVENMTPENAERALWFAQTLWNEYTDPDQEGGPVIYGDVVHIGADEYWDHSTAGIRDKFALFADSLRQVIQGNLGSDTKIRMWGAGSVMFSTADSVLEEFFLQRKEGESYRQVLMIAKLRTKVNLLKRGNKALFKNIIALYPDITSKYRHLLSIKDRVLLCLIEKGFYQLGLWYIRIGLSISKIK